MISQILLIIILRQAHIPPYSRMHERRNDGIFPRAEIKACHAAQTMIRLIVSLAIMHTRHIRRAKRANKHMVYIIIQRSLAGGCLRPPPGVVARAHKPSIYIPNPGPKEKYMLVYWYAAAKKAAEKKYSDAPSTVVCEALAMPYSRVLGACWLCPSRISLAVGCL